MDSHKCMRRDSVSAEFNNGERSVPESRVLIIMTGEILVNKAIDGYYFVGC